jgi:hypothetical protein
MKMSPSVDSTTSKSLRKPTPIPSIGTLYCPPSSSPSSIHLFIRIIIYRNPLFPFLFSFTFTPSLLCSPSSVLIFIPSFMYRDPFLSFCSFFSSFSLSLLVHLSYSLLRSTSPYPLMCPALFHVLHRSFPQSFRSNFFLFMCVMYAFLYRRCC